MEAEDIRDLTRPFLLDRYFLAASPTTERHLYQARLPSTGALDDFASNMTALTDTSVPGYHSASFSPRSGFYLLNYLGPDIPKQTLVTVDEPGKGIDVSWYKLELTHLTLSRT